MQFDILFLLRQSGIISLFIFAPLLCAAIVSRRRRWLMPSVMICVLLAYAILFLALMSEIGTIDRGSLPYQPFRAGPSDFALWDIFRLLTVTLWAPSVIVYFVFRLVLRPRHLSARTVIALTLTYSIVATSLTWVLLRTSEWSHEDTFTAQGFSWPAWQRIRVGMSRREVEANLGAPIPTAFKPAFAREQGAECWVSNLSAGYFAAVWFDGDRVTRKQFWHSD